MVTKARKPSPKRPKLLWFRLLKQQKDRGLTGLTPSFLIGAALLPASDKLDADNAYGGLVELLSAFADATPPGFHVLIGYCTKLEQPIASLYPTDEEMPPCHHVLRGNAKHSALYAESRYFRGKRREFDALVAGLLDVFQSPLVTGDYSYRNGAYCSFSAQDLKIIATAVKHPGT
jgi:hypothetical protein